MQRFVQKITVTAEHIDGLMHVNNVQYLYWVQEIAKAHWQALTQTRIDIQGVWVVRTHTIDYKKPAFQGDPLRIETHIQSLRGPLSQRQVCFYHDQSNALIARCTTQWCYMDTLTRKPLSAPAFMGDFCLNAN